MRASTLTFIFIISEYSIITGGDGNCGNPPDINNTEKAKNTPNTKFRMMCKPGYMRKAGTSNLFKCENNMWVNNPPLKCIEPPYKSTQNSTPHSTFTPSWSSNNGTQAMNSTPTVSGKTVSTTIHTASTTSWTSHRTTQRTTTTTEETSVSTSITARIAASSTTEKDSLSVSMSSHSPSSRSTTSTGVSVVPDQQTGETTKGITAGIGIIITVVVFAAIVGFLLWRRRSTPPETSDRFVEKTRQNPGSDTPLMRVQTITSCSPDSTEPPASPLIDSTEIKYTNISISA